MGIIYSSHFKVIAQVSSLCASKMLAWAKLSWSFDFTEGSKEDLYLSGSLVQATEISSGYFKQKMELLKNIAEFTDGRGTRVLLRTTSWITPEFCLWGHGVAAFPLHHWWFWCWLNTAERNLHVTILMFLFFPRTFSKCTYIFVSIQNGIHFFKVSNTWWIYSWHAQKLVSYKTIYCRA